MKKDVIIVGSGNSGRGMLGELFFKDGQYHVIFADIDSDLVSGLKKQKYYHVKKTNLSSGQSEITKVDDFEIIDVSKEHREFIDKMCQVDLICTALRADGFDLAISNFVEMIKKRYICQVNSKVYITLGANYVGLYEYYNSRIEERLTPAELKYYKDKVSLVMSIVNRKNLTPFIEEALDPYSIDGDDKPVLRVERDAIKGLNPMPAFFQPENNLSAAMAIKIWAGNVVQCSMAFVAIYKGYRSTYDAAMDDECYTMAYASALEATFGVYQEYKIEGSIEEKARTSIDLFRNKDFSDDLYRIAAQPIRKIAYNDRFIGPARMAMKHGKKPEAIIDCMVYGFVIDVPGDQQFKELKQSIYKYGIRKTAKKYCGLSEENTDENLIINMICESYQKLIERGD